MRFLGKKCFRKFHLLFRKMKVLMVFLFSVGIACLGKMWFSKFGLKILSASEIPSFFYVEYIIVWVHFLIGDLTS